MRPTELLSWHYNVDREVRLDSPADRVFVRYTGKPAVNNVRIYAHCLDRRTPSDSRVQVTHVWEADGQSHRKQFIVQPGGKYAIEVAGEPKNVSIEMSVPSNTK